MFKKGNQNQYLLFGGLALVLLLAIIFTPSLATAGLPILLLLACPLMMMFMMMGGNHGGMQHGGGSQGDHSDHTDHSQHSSSALLSAPQAQFRSREEEVAWLKSELADLKLRQDRLLSEVNRLENPVVAEAAAVARAADERFTK